MPAAMTAIQMVIVSVACSPLWAPATVNVEITLAAVASLNGERGDSAMGRTPKLDCCSCEQEGAVGCWPRRQALLLLPVSEAELSR